MEASEAGACLGMQGIMEVGHLPAHHWEIPLGMLAPMYVHRLAPTYVICDGRIQSRLFPLLLGTGSLRPSTEQMIRKWSVGQ